jgi:hypothetical protein
MSEPVYENLAERAKQIAVEYVISEAWAAKFARKATHAVAFTLSPTWYRSRFTCSGDPTSNCHLDCENSGGCEQYPCDHMPVDRSTCNVVDWLEAEEAEDTYDGPETAARNGPIEIEWNGDGYVWHYATEAPHEG